MTFLLLRHFQLFNRAGHDLVQDKIIYLWHVLAVEAYNKRKSFEETAS